MILEIALDMGGEWVIKFMGEISWRHTTMKHNKYAKHVHNSCDVLYCPSSQNAEKSVNLNDGFENW